MAVSDDNRRWWSKFAPFVAFVLLAVGICFGFKDMPTQMGITSIIAIALLFLSEFSSLESLAVSLTGITAARRKAKESADEAEGIVAKLRELAAMQAKATMSATHSSSDKARVLVRRKDRVLELLSSFGVSKADRDEVERLWRRHIVLIYLTGLDHALHRQHRESAIPSSAYNVWIKLLDRITELPSKEEIESAVDKIYKVANPPGTAFRRRAEACIVAMETGDIGTHVDFDSHDRWQWHDE